MAKHKHWYWFIWEDGPSSFLHGVAVFVVTTVPAFLGVKLVWWLGVIGGLVGCAAGILFYYDREYGLKRNGPGDLRESKLLGGGLADYWKAKLDANAAKMADARADFLGAVIGGVLGLLTAAGIVLGW